MLSERRMEKTRRGIPLVYSYHKPSPPSPSGGIQTKQPSRRRMFHLNQYWFTRVTNYVGGCLVPWDSLVKVHPYPTTKYGRSHYVPYYLIFSPSFLWGYNKFPLLIRLLYLIVYLYLHEFFSKLRVKITVRSKNWIILQVTHRSWRINPD